MPPIEILHHFLDWDFGEDGLQRLEKMLKSGADPNHVDQDSGEALIHVAARRRRLDAVKLLVQHGAEVDQKNRHGKTAYVHSVRRGFVEIVDFFKEAGADRSLNESDQFAVAMTSGNLDQAKRILQSFPMVIKTGNPEEDRLLADLAGRPAPDSIEFLVRAGADLEAKALDGGAALHQAAWFGQFENVKILVEAGANLDCFDNDHESSPIGWAVHGSQYSGGAEENIETYKKITRFLLDAGSSLEYPDRFVDPPTPYYNRLEFDAVGPIREILVERKPANAEGEE